MTELDVKLDAVVYFELPLEEIVARLSGRRTCTSCRAVFHVSSQPPIVPDVCDHCDGRLIQRDDDQPEIIRDRMRAYETETRPLVDYYDHRGELQRVRAAGSPEEIFDRTIKVLGQIGIARHLSC